MSIEAMKQALEALEWHQEHALSFREMGLNESAITALRTAIEQAEKQAPVPWSQALESVWAEDDTTPPAAQTAPAQKPLAWADEIIADLHALYDSEMITENDSGDALIRLDAAICAVEEAEERHTTTPAAQRQPLTKEQALKLWGPRSDGPDNHEIISFARAIEAAHGIKEKNT